MLSPRHSIFALIFGGFAALAATVPSAAQTPAWPRGSVKFIIPLGPGAGVDITARLFADKLSAKWGQPVVVENRPGGDAFVAITAVISAQRRSRAAVRARFDVHGASAAARQAALQDR